MLTLHFAPNTCALATLIVQEEFGLDYRLEPIDFGAGQQRSPAFLALNPKGRTPVLATPQGALSETPALLDYLARLAGDLLPADPFDQTRRIAFSGYLCATVHVAHAHRMRGYRWADDPAAWRAMQARVPASVAEAFAVVEDWLAPGPLVMGETYSIGDPYLFTLAKWLEADGVDPGRLPRVLSHRASVGARPAVQRSLALVEQLRR